MLKLARIPTAIAMALVAGWALAQTADPVVLVLHAEANVSGKIVKIGDIARLEGGSAGLRDAFAKLDIAEWHATGDRLVVARNDVKFRLLIRGYSESSFVIAGPPRCVVGRGAPGVQAVPGAQGGSPFSEEAARRAMQQAVADRAPELAKFLVAKLDGVPQFPLLRIEDTDRVRLEGKLLDQGLPLGRTRGQILVLVNGEQKAVVQAAFDVSFAQAEPLQVPDRTGPLIPSRNRPGTRSPSGANAEGAAPEMPTEFLVKSRDRVQMIAIIGHVCATMPGEALQDGRMGQTISVRNVDSSKTVSGRVIGRGMVEIERRTGTQP